MNTAKLSIADDYQTVILPKEFHFAGNEVYVKKIGDVLVLISKENPWKTFFDSLNMFSDDFMLVREQLPLETREDFE
ncbi:MULTISPECIES: type II toxin-antitoxin system VapB family antitoxin [unclassified Microcoleus]|uniref:type II toxin-antitoxin system VapB family antitoxin n=1 Tax=unclassified Microcoleus TaxID=2642155 RepID=UPI002FD3F956